jgi:hypothetical protein
MESHRYHISDGDPVATIASNWNMNKHFRIIKYQEGTVDLVYLIGCSSLLDAAGCSSGDLIGCSSIAPGCGDDPGVVIGRSKWC